MTACPSCAALTVALDFAAEDNKVIAEQLRERTVQRDDLRVKLATAARWSEHQAEVIARLQAWEGAA